MPKISVICVTNRTGALPILDANLSKQTFRDFEVIVADDLCESEVKNDILQYFKPRGKAEGDAWNLNKAYNDCLDRATGELLVFYQDYIWIPANGLERFWDMYQLYPNAFITGCGHKAQLPDQLPITDFSRPTGISEIDERANTLAFVETNWTFWELNWASAPRILMPRFNEDMDKHYGGENTYIAYVAHMQDVPFYLDGLNQCVGYNQILFGRPNDWEKNHSNKEGRLAAHLKKV